MNKPKPEDYGYDGLYWPTKEAIERFWADYEKWKKLEPNKA